MIWKIANDAMFKAKLQAIVPWTTLNNLLIAAKAKIGLFSSNYDAFQRPTQVLSPSTLTTQEDRDLLQNIAKARDEMNRGMSRKEMIILMSELFSTSFKAAENHFDYLIKMKQLNELKRGGLVISCQATTTNRTVITTQKLLRTHNTTALAWEKQAEWNGWNFCLSF
jgi:hypothetical protein